MVIAGGHNDVKWSQKRHFLISTQITGISHHLNEAERCSVSKEGRLLGYRPRQISENQALKSFLSLLQRRGRTGVARSGRVSA